MKKGIAITFVFLAVAAAAYYFLIRKVSKCPPARNPDKFPAAWDEENRNSGGLHRMAEQYADPILGDDTNANGSIVGGFFKGIDVYPSDSAAKYYKKWLIEYLESDEALPWWNIQKGEFLC